MKNKELATQKRRQAAAEREKARRKALSKKKAEAKPKKATSPVSGEVQVTDEQFSDDQHLFWLCHGVNYLVSDHNQGLWTPLFPEIYEGTLPQPEQVADRVVQKYSAYPKEWPLEGKAALGWTVQSKEVVYVYYKESLRRLAARHPDGDAEALCKLAHDPVVWGLFHFLKDRLLPSRAKAKAHQRRAR